LSLIVVCTAPGLAQETRGSIEGVVKDSTGGALPGVVVEARSPSLVGVSTAASDATGSYRFPALAPGVYSLTVTLQGFTPAKQERIVLELGQILTINFTLAPGSVTETVNVVAVSPVIDVKQNAAAATVESEAIERIPKGRDFTTLVAFTAPGAQSESRNGGLQFDGSSGSENRYYIDGMDRTNLRTGLAGGFETNTGGNPELLTDFIQQMVIKSSGYNAEHRAATGGTVSVVTKSGSNQWRGSIGTYFNSDSLQGQERPSIRLNPRDQTKAEYIVTPPDQYTLWEPTLDLGGPLLHDRLWFYAGYVPRIRRDARTTTFQSNGQTGVFHDDTTDHNGNYNVTAQLTKALRAKFAVSNERFLDGTDSRPTLEPDGTSASNPALFPSPLKRDTFDDSYTGVVDYVASNRFYVNVTAGYWLYGTRGSGAGSALRHTFSGSNFQFAEIPDTLKNVSNFSDALSNTSTLYDDFGRIGVNSDGTYYGSWRGQHALKVGLQFERLSNRVLDGAVAPNITLLWDASRATLDGRRVRGTYGYYTITENRSEGDIAYNNIGLFLQDSWTIHNRVTLNLGVRTDRQDIPSYNPENPGIHFGFGQMISPRLGFAWDVAGDSRWKVYGGWGNYFDIAKLEFPRGLFGAQRQITYYHTLDTFNWPAIQCGYPPVPSPTCPGTYIEQVDFRHPANARDNPLVDPKLKPVQAQEYSIGVDHELSGRMSVGVRFVHKWMFRTFEDTGVQVPGVGEVFRITNPGENLGENVLRDFGGCPTCPNQPKPQRDYDGLELRLKRRLANHWSFNTSYTLSRLTGNYSGLASSDEAGRTSPNVNRFFDGQYNSFDAQGRPVFGRLGTDRPHSWKGDTSYDFKWGTSVGVQYILESGTPLQTQMSEKNIPFFPFGRNDLGRTPLYHQANLLVQHDIRLAGARRVNVNVNVLNLFDQDIATAYTLTPYRDSFNISDQQFFAGFDPVALARATTSIRPDPRFNLPSAFQTRRSIQLNARYSF
jgi:hypothetical protein